MQFARLGSSGIEVSRLCIGTATFGAQADAAESFAILERCAAEGVNFIDTANAYPLGSAPQHKGESERLVGKWLKGRRNGFVLATKGGAVMGPRSWERGNSRKHLLDAIDRSLERLDTDYVDLYQLHYDDLATPLDESLAALDHIVRSGRARYAGLSNFQAWRAARAIGRCETHGWSRPAVIQPRYNLLFRQIERDLLPLCQEVGLGVICFNPLAGGLLSGKHRFDAPASAQSRFGAIAGADLYRERYWHEREFHAVAQFMHTAVEAGLPPVRLAVSWVLAKSAITSVILGASRAEQLGDALSSVDAPLDAALVGRLDSLSHEFRMGDAAR
jgi:1-deoxyxylulose-5-phosphate synthase